MLVFNQQNERAAPIHSLDSVIASKKKKTLKMEHTFQFILGFCVVSPFEFRESSVTKHEEKNY